ncbi:MAG TPA: carboxypeptidase-like regulatory domain-containing protein, partial [Anaerolineales bacterium]
LLGLFDSGCGLLDSDDDGGPSRDSQIYFHVPADGVFILAASSYPDWEFSGAGASSGEYRLSVSASAVTLSISGRVVDAVTGEPLPGDSDPQAYVSLSRCQVEADILRCDESVNSSYTDAQGRFRFESDYEGRPLPAELYMLVIFAQDYQVLQTGAFMSAADQDTDLGDLAMTPNPVKIRLEEGCEGLPANGGECRFKVRVTNQQAEALRGAAWSVVTASGLDSFLGYTTFQIGVPKPALIGPVDSKVYTFKFTLPSNTTDYTAVCPGVFFGKTVNNPYYNLLGDHYFCLTRDASGYSLVTGGEAIELIRQVNGMGGAEKPEKLPPEK